MMKGQHGGEQLRDHIQGLRKAVQDVTHEGDSSEGNPMIDDDRHRPAMSLDQQHRQHADDEMLTVRTSPPSSLFPAAPNTVSPATRAGEVISAMLPPLLKHPGGLSRVPESTLEQQLQPVLNALKHLDAERLLDLQPAASSMEGPLVRKGRPIQPIYDQVSPPMEEANEGLGGGRNCVRYLHISEIENEHSIGIFVFAPFARIPLHDHPDMCVLSRVLYGDLQRLSLDVARDNDMDDDIALGKTTASSSKDISSLHIPMDLETAAKKMSDNHRSNGNGTSWLGGRLFHKDQQPPKPAPQKSINQFPKGTKKAYRNHIEKLQAPDVTILYPYKGNLHEFVAGPHGAAVLDVLLPPYDNSKNRDCTFYEIHDANDFMETSSFSSPEEGGYEYSSNDNTGRKEACYIVPTGQPENFHCISGHYRDLGDSDD